MTLTGSSPLNWLIEFMLDQLVTLDSGPCLRPVMNNLYVFFIQSSDHKYILIFLVSPSSSGSLLDYR